MAVMVIPGRREPKIPDTTLIAVWVRRCDLMYVLHVPALVKVLITPLRPGSNMSRSHLPSSLPPSLSALPQAEAPSTDCCVKAKERHAVPTIELHPSQESLVLVIALFRQPICNDHMCRETEEGQRTINSLE